MKLGIFIYMFLVTLSWYVSRPSFPYVVVITGGALFFQAVLEIVAAIREVRK